MSGRQGIMCGMYVWREQARQDMYVWHRYGRVGTPGSAYVWHMHMHANA